MSPMPSMLGDGPATEIEYVPKTVGRALRIWWAFYWRKLILFAALVAALVMAVDRLNETGSIPFRFSYDLIGFGPYVVNYAAALFVLHFILRKQFKTFRIALVAIQNAAAEPLPPTPSRTLRIWWTYSWRTFAYSIGIYLVVSLPMALLVGTLGTIFPRWNDVFAYSAALAIEGAAGLFVIYSNILDEDFGDFRVLLLSRPGPTPATTVAPVTPSAKN
jgi:hypothetical protein